MKRLGNIGRLFTSTPVGVIEDAAVIFDGEEIVWCGKHGNEPRELMESVIDDHDCARGLVTAGLIDAHTHPVYAGDR
ncbi:MAG TPA: imidazolonepropionase, partial [Candidatus Dormibacteraeota bacterium]|nr:imidazolonepropionase [Candidatus Dormibacteraeota bacterium]